MFMVAGSAAKPTREFRMADTDTSLDGPFGTTEAAKALVAEAGQTVGEDFPALPDDLKRG
jgi:hypothetical protein